MRVTSADPVYRCSAADIRARIAATFDEVIEQTRRNADEFVWTAPIASVDALAAIRMAAMHAFLDDFGGGRTHGRYVDASLPSLPFRNGEFSLALCSHFLFLYTAQLDEAFHLASVRELCRVADQVRIFPLPALGATPSAHVPVVAEALRRDGFDVAIDAVPYEFQRGGNRMMRITRSAARAGRGRTDGA